MVLAECVEIFGLPPLHMYVYKSEMVPKIILCTVNNFAKSRALYLIYISCLPFGHNVQWLGGMDFEIATIQEEEISGSKQSAIC